MIDILQQAALAAAGLAGPIAAIVLCWRHDSRRRRTP